MRMHVFFRKGTMHGIKINLDKIKAVESSQRREIISGKYERKK